MRRDRILAAVWLLAVIVVSMQAAVHHTNNFETFRTSWFNLIEGHDLYGPSERHLDFFKYSPTFALLFAPFAVLPFWLGVLLWNALNAGALYYAMGRILGRDEAFAARLLVLFDTIGAMQNVQSNALVAGMMIFACTDLDRRRELRGAAVIAIATAIKLFPIVAATYAIFRQHRLPRFTVYSIAAAMLLVAAPVLVISRAELTEQYISWGAIQRVDSLDRGYSVMQQLQLWLGLGWPNWPVQLLGIVVLLAPLARYALWGQARFRLLFLASLLMFCVLFNHKSESPTFVVALSGIAIWFAVMDRTAWTWTVLVVVVIGTVLSSSDAMPQPLQQGFFEPYRLKILPVVLVWVLTQVELWRVPQNATTRLPWHAGPPSATAT